MPRFHQPIPNYTAITALAVAFLTIASFIALRGVAAYNPPTQAPLAGTIFGFLNLSPNLQYKLGPLSATSFFDTDNPNYLINPSGISTAGAPPCPALGHGTHAAATKAYVDRCLQNGAC